MTRVSSYCPICVDDHAHRRGEEKRKVHMVCGACQAQSYCSKKHQKKHWPIHKKVCKERSRIYQDVCIHCQS